MRNEAELAAVVGHEMGHIVARHGEERMSQKMLAGIIVAGGATAIGLSDMDNETQGIAIAALGAGATVGVLLSYSRQHEYEADHLSAPHMAQAGYDPQHAAGFWHRFADGKGGGSMSDFMSTRPADSKRIVALDRNMPGYKQLLQSVPTPLGPGHAMPSHFKS
jgi:predicted Zn-dependent protease